MRAVKKPLERPYTGPHKVFRRESNRVFQIEVNGNECSVSCENLKPAHFVPELVSDVGIGRNDNVVSQKPPVLRTHMRKKIDFKLDSAIVSVFALKKKEKSFARPRF